MRGHRVQAARPVPALALDRPPYPILRLALWAFATLFAVRIPVFSRIVPGKALYGAYLATYDMFDWAGQNVAMGCGRGVHVVSLNRGTETCGLLRGGFCSAFTKGVGFSSRVSGTLTANSLRASMPPQPRI